MGGLPLLASDWKGGFQVDVYDQELDQAWEVKEGAGSVRTSQLDEMAGARFKGGWAMSRAESLHREDRSRTRRISHDSEQGRKYSPNIYKDTMSSQKLGSPT